MLNGNDLARGKFPPRPFTSQSHVKPDVMKSEENASRSAGLDVADIILMRSGESADAGKTANTGTPTDKSRLNAVNYN